MFGYECRDFIIDDDKLSEYPTCDGNNTKTSRFGFQRADDSIAHACLFIFPQETKVKVKIVTWICELQKFLLVCLSDCNKCVSDTEIYNFVIALALKNA